MCVYASQARSVPAHKVAYLMAVNRRAGKVLFRLNYCEFVRSAIEKRLANQTHYNKTNVQLSYLSTKFRKASMVMLKKKPMETWLSYLII